MPWRDEYLAAVHDIQRGLGEQVELSALVSAILWHATQYFANVPPLAWEFYIGGYQPAQKWLKDRKDRTLDFEDVAHYRRIIAALIETDRLMGEVDKIGVV